MPIFDFKDASLRGPPLWSNCSTFTSLAPPLILLLLLLSITQIVVGVIWLVSIQSATSDLTFAQVIQPLIVPALSFFNTIPSLHLHVLARSNRPGMAMAFSSILAVCYFASAVVFLPPCAAAGRWGRGFGGNSGEEEEQTGYAATECPVGSRKGAWAAMVALQFLSGVGYATYFCMAAKVRRWARQRERDEREGRVLVVVDPVEKARREEEARQRWREIRDL